MKLTKLGMKLTQILHLILKIEIKIYNYKKDLSVKIK